MKIKRIYRCLAPSCLHESDELVLEDVTQAIQCSQCGSVEVEIKSELHQSEKEALAWKTNA